MNRTLSFNKSLRIEGRREKISGDSGAVLAREVLEQSGVVRRIAKELKDPRNPAKIKHPLPDLLRTAVLLAAQGRRDQNDAGVFRDDPAFRLAASGRAGTTPLEAERSLPSQPTLSRLTRALAEAGNLKGLRTVPYRLAGWRLRVLNGGRRPRRVTVDIDSLPVEVHGEQPGSAWNGYYKARVYHPLAASLAETGDLLDMRLRKGNAHTAGGGLEYISEVVALVKRFVCGDVRVRFDAGFPGEPLMAALEAKGIPFVARIKKNAALDDLGEPAVDALASLRMEDLEPDAEVRTLVRELGEAYRAKSWSRPRRVVQALIERPGELFPDTFWLLTSFPADEVPAPGLLRLYRRRGKAEGHFGEFKTVVDPALSSSPRPKSHYRGRRVAPRVPDCDGSAAGTKPGDGFAPNQVRLLVSVIGYQVIHCLRVFLERATRRGWGLQQVMERVLRAPARFVVSGRRVTMILSAAALRWETLFHELLRLRYAACAPP